MALPLFDDPPEVDALSVRRHSERLFYDCPHCGLEMSQADDAESIEELRADPACCFCRAEFAGMPFTQWRKLPMDVKLTHRPADEWRSSAATAIR